MTHIIMGQEDARGEKRRAYRDATSRKNLPMIMGSTPRRPGRPNRYTPELGELLCERMLEAGGVPEACQMFEELPDEICIYKWTYAHADFAAMIGRAREVLMERYVDDMRRIAADSTLEPNEKRVQLDLLKWLVSRLAARRYGDKLQIGGDPDNPLVMLYKAADVERLSPAALDALEAFTTAVLDAKDAEATDIVDGNSDLGG